MTETTMHHIHKIETSSYQDTLNDRKYSITKIEYYNEDGDCIHRTTIFGKPQLEITKGRNND